MLNVIARHMQRRMSLPVLRLAARAMVPAVTEAAGGGPAMIFLAAVHMPSTSRPTGWAGWHSPHPARPVRGLLKLLRII